MSDIRIVIGGPQHSGKSTFAIYLERALTNLGINVYNQDYDPFSPTKDYALGIISNEERKKRKKKVLSKEARSCSKKFISLSAKYDLLIGDLPGKITDITEILVSGGTHAIILCRDDELGEIDQWKNFFEQQGLDVIAIIESNLNGTESVKNNGIISAKISNLDINNIGDTPSIVLAIGALIKSKIGI